MVENLPISAQNVVVWNILIAAAIKSNRFKLAFELYYDVCLMQSVVMYGNTDPAF